MGYRLSAVDQQPPLNRKIKIKKARAAGATARRRRAPPVNSVAVPRPWIRLHPARRGRHCSRSQAAAARPPGATIGSPAACARRGRRSSRLAALGPDPLPLLLPGLNPPPLGRQGRCPALGHCCRRCCRAQPARGHRYRRCCCGRERPAVAAASRRRRPPELARPTHTPLLLAEGLIWLEGRTGNLWPMLGGRRYREGRRWRRGEGREEPLLLLGEREKIERGAAAEEREKKGERCGCRYSGRGI
ncbi:hypothetical protein PVAP13_5NG249781 [Panicum virgatum]|uniref:Uncharacterized protein n=1 Tax=Panicum virgatum TaxID=38727 RepID=A0A8T0RUQ6_PANVG|nr:hypothetical protein PVAP13_5NG249781 [Panicum virgatum]